MRDRAERMCGGLDVGGTKIEATLFDAARRPVRTVRRSTPMDGYDSLLAALIEEIAGLRLAAGDPALPVGLGIPGLVDPETGHAVTANLPATGHPLARDLMRASGGVIVVQNDCKCFALSEANGGSGAAHHGVFGLILGTGVGGGMCHGGRLVPGLNHLAGEVGHHALPAHLVAEFGLPLRTCGCGRIGCYETYVSGRGLAALCKVATGRSAEAPQIVELASRGDAEMDRVLGIWARLTGELLHAIQLHLDPECIVLGGGLSNIPGIQGLLSAALKRSALPGLREPAIYTPTFGDSSGARGAAILALQEIK